MWARFWTWATRISVVLTIIWYVYLMWQPLTVAFMVILGVLMTAALIGRSFELYYLSTEPNDLDRAPRAYDINTLVPLVMGIWLAIKFCIATLPTDSAVVAILMLLFVGMQLLIGIGWRFRSTRETQIRLGMVYRQLEQSGVDMAQLRREFLAANRLRADPHN